MKYHINDRGDVRPCTAQLQCRFGDREHYATAKEARQAYEQQATAAKPRPKTWHDFTSEPTGAELRVLVKAAKEQNVYMPAAHNRVEGQALSLEIEYDGTGSAYGLVEKHGYLIITPTGELVQMEFETSLDAQWDGYWQFHPTLFIAYQHYPTVKAYLEARKNGERLAGEIRLSHEDEDSVLREATHGGSRPAYDYGDERSTAAAARMLLHAMEKPYAVARHAQLLNSSKRMDPAVVAKLAAAEQDYVRAAAARRPELPRNVQPTLAQDGRVAVRQALATRRDLSVAVLKTLLQQNSHHDQASHGTIRELTLASPSLTPALMTTQARKGSLKDLKALARNAKLTAEARAIMEQRIEGLGLAMPWAN